MGKGHVYPVTLLAYLRTSTRAFSPQARVIPLEIAMPYPGHRLTLGLLPEPKRNWRSWFTSYAALTLFVLLLINVGLFFPEKLQLIEYHTTSWISVDLTPPKPPEEAPKPVVRKLLPPPEPIPVEHARLTVPREIREQHQQPQPEVAPPKITTGQFMPAVLKAGGARPELVVHTGEFGSSATPTVNAPIQKVQTGGFGDPNGVPGVGKPNAHLQIASAGSFDLPPGPGRGNGTGGAKGIAGTVASAGFGNGIATPGQGDGRSSGRGSVQSAGFATQEAGPGAPKQPRPVDVGPVATPVEVTYKPNPVYTQEARQLKLEGEVLLEVMFGANGQLHVNRVVRGMGHGLDEAAVAAATKIRFKPAMRNGQPVDSTAIVHVVFQLAY
jgi:TonB family protein